MLAVIEGLGMRLIVLYMYCVESGEEWPDITADSLWETPSTRPPGNIALKSGQEKEVERKGRDGGGRGGGGQVALERQQQQEQRQREEDKAVREREREEQQRQLEEQRRKKEEEEERLVTLV